jgi:predicted acylesterase/phospholipase RssA/CRP-like cAMP-binding protein
MESLLEATFSVHLDRGVLEELAADLEFVHLRGGETLMREGEPGDSMYAVTGGRLRSFVKLPDGSEQVVGEIGVGEWVGEMALIAGRDRSATVRAIRDTELLRITRHGFGTLIAERPDAMLELTQEIVLRMSKLMHTSPHDTRIRTIAVLATGPGVPLESIRDDFTRALRAFGPVMWLDRSRFDSELGEGSADTVADAGPDSRRIDAWQSEQESVHRFVVYEAHDDAAAWSARCIRQADRIVLVGRADGSSSPGTGERRLADLRNEAPIATQELVLLHGDRVRTPSGTEAWLDGRNLVRHTHVRMGHRPDFDRLARFLAGRAIGVVLGGGGARGFAHIGVLRALTEARIPVDVVGGVSMGAIIAAQFAMGWDHETMVAENRAGIAEGKFGRDVTLPLISLNSGRRFGKVLTSFFDDTHIEDLWLPYLCVSCNLTTASAVTHQRGRLTRAVMASNAAPAIFPPVVEDGDLLVDGGLINNEPGDIVKAVCGGPVIVVNVSPADDAGMHLADPELPSPWTVLGRRLSPFRDAVEHPGIAAMIMRSLMVGSRSKSRDVEHMADYYLRPPIEGFRVDDYKKIEEIVDVGYLYAKDQIASWSLAVGEA